MTNEVTPTDHKRMINAYKVDNTRKRIRKKRRCREKNMSMLQSPTVMFPLQRLYMSCLDVFKGVGTVPSPSGDRKLRHILDGLKLEDIGLPRNLHFLKSDGIILYTIIYECQNFSLYAFILPENATIPLHNHPETTVFNKLLFGKVHIKAYDLVDHDIADNNPSPSQPKLACLKTDRVFTTPCDASVLYPTSGGNIHTFTAITPCAFLDVVGPPYSEKDGRDCTYYRDISHITQYDITAVNMKKPDEDSNSYRWLEEIEKPKESDMDRIAYHGPQIIEVGP